jgi:hypothetical protein
MCAIFAAVVTPNALLPTPKYGLQTINVPRKPTHSILFRLLTHFATNFLSQTAIRLIFRQVLGF